MNIVQTFYDNLASHYDKLFCDWQSATREQAVILEKIFTDNGYPKTASVLDCACGIGTQAIGIAGLGYQVTGSDVSTGALKEAKARACANHVDITFRQADFRTLYKTFASPFDLVICMDNALPHMLTKEDLTAAVESIADTVAPGGMFVASIRDYDALLTEKPGYSPPYIHETEKGKRVSFQTWTWEGDNYKLTQYIIDDGATLCVNKFDCEYRTVRRAELTNLLLNAGFSTAEWLFPENTGFYQPVVISKK